MGNLLLAIKPPFTEIPCPYFVAQHRFFQFNRIEVVTFSETPVTFLRETLVPFSALLPTPAVVI
jgi:hypothetical protein